MRTNKFGMFGTHSKPISTVLAWFKVDFGHFGHQPIRSDSADTTRFWLNWPKSTRIPKKKKKTQTRHQSVGSGVGDCTPRRAALDSSTAPSHLRWCFLVCCSCVFGLCCLPFSVVWMQTIPNNSNNQKKKNLILSPSHFVCHV